MKRLNSQTSLLLIVISLIIISFIVFSLGCIKKQEHEIKIGAVLSLTGKGAKYGESIRHGIELALEEVNAEPNRKAKFKVDYEDSLSEPQKAVAAFNKLIEIDKVQIVIGPVLSSEVLACAPIANQKKIVILNTSAGTEDLRKAGDYVFRNRESAYPQAFKIAELCRSTLKIEKMAIMYSNSPNGKDYKDAFMKRFEELGGKILQTETYEEGETDFRSQILKIKKNHPQGVYLAGLVAELGYILKQSKELRVDTRFFASAGIEGSKLFDIAGDSAEGVIFGSPAFDPSSNEPIIKNFVLKYRQKYNQTPDFFAANAYDALRIIVQAIEKSGNASDGIKNALYGTKDYPGVGGNTTFDSDGEVIKPIRIKIIKDNKFTAYE
jgi:branched-chain amino acid transport system substrate-binding protein